MRWIWLLAPLLAGQAQQLPESPLLLAAVKTKVIENVVHLPDYTCAVTIDRQIKPGSSKQFQSRDLVHLEVAMVGGDEVYGWPGAHRIAESELASLVGGTIGNGDFGLLIKSIFLNAGASFRFAGSEKLEGTATLRFEYRVPLAASGYRLKVPPNEAVVGYHGAFWVQRSNLELIRLDLAADDIPEDLGLVSSTETIAYEQMKIAAGEFLLPRGSRLEMVDFDGTENRNQTSFHNCHQYSGESVLSFGDPPPEAPPPVHAEIQGMDLPQDFSATLSLVTPINSETAAVGDPVEARLEDNVRAGKKLIVPKGAILSGRIAELHRQREFFHLALAFDSLDYEGHHTDLRRRENRISLLRTGAHAADTAFQYMYQTTPADGGALVFESKRVKLGQGMLLNLRSRLLKSDKQ